MTANAEKCFTVNGITSTAETLLRLGLLRRDPSGNLLTTGKYPQAPIPAAPPDYSGIKPSDPYSLKGLRLRGFYVLPGPTTDEDRVMIGGGYYRISEAKKHGLI